jgi:hypothetical protein
MIFVKKVDPLVNVKNYFLIIVVVLFCNQTHAQQIEHYNQTWMGYNNTTRLNDHWGIWLDAQYKTKSEFTKNYDVNEKTLGAIFYPNEKIKITNAFSYVQSYPNFSLPKFEVPELRPWQMIQWKSNAGPVKLSHWFRIEERFKHKTLNSNSLANGYDFSFRFRYNVFAQLPITKIKYDKGAFSLVGSDELYLSYGKQIIYNSFDQNRVFIGVFYYLNKHDFLQVGYTNAFQHLSAKDKYKSVDAIKISFFNNLDFRRKS